MTQTLIGLSDKTDGYMFELRGEIFSCARNDLQDELNPLGVFAFVLRAQSQATVIHSEADSYEVSLDTRGKLLLVGEALVRLIFNGTIQYYRVEMVDGKLTSRLICESRRLDVWSFSESLAELITLGFAAEVAKNILYESGPYWQIVLNEVIGVIADETANNRKEVQIVTAGAMRIYDQAERRKVRMVREFLRDGAGWTVETNETVMMYIRVMAIIANQDFLPGEGWAVEPEEGQPADLVEAEAA